MPLQHFRIQGHIYYVTFVTYKRLRIFRRPSFIIPLIDSLNFYRYQHQCKLIGFVIMPDHVHLLLFPIGESYLGEFMRDFKRFTSGRIARQAKLEGITEWVNAFADAGEETNRGENKVWQDDYWDKHVYTEMVLRQKLNYIHRNPVRANLVDAPEKYPYSSYQNYVVKDHRLIEVDMGWTQ